MKKKKIIFLTLYLLVFIVTCSVGTTASRYFDTDEYSYSLGYEKLSMAEEKKSLIEYTINYGRSGLDKFVVEFNIPRNDKWNNDSTEIYYGSDNQQCSLHFGNDVKKGFDSYTDDNKGNFSVSAICPITDSTTNIEFSYAISGKYNDEDGYEYISDSYNFNENINTYIGKVLNGLVIQDNQILVPKDYASSGNTSIGYVLANWLKTKVFLNDLDLVDESTNKDTLTEYIKTFDSNYNLGIVSYYTNRNSIKGIDVDDTGEYYKISVSNKNMLKSYVLTYYYSFRSKKPFYFLDNSMSNTEINNLFLYYIDKYMYSKSDSSTKKKYDAIKVYIDSLNGQSIIDKVLTTPKPVELCDLSYSNGILEVGSSFEISYENPITKTIESRFNTKSLAFSYISKNSGISKDLLTSSSKISSAFDRYPGAVTGGFYFVDSNKVLRTNYGNNPYSYLFYTLYKGLDFEFEYASTDTFNSQSVIDDLLNPIAVNMYGQSGINITSSDFELGTNKTLDTNIGTIVIDGMKLKITLKNTVAGYAMSIPSNDRMMTFASVNEDLELNNSSDNITLDENSSSKKVELEKNDVSNGVIPSTEDNSVEEDNNDNNEDNKVNENDDYEIPQNSDSEPDSVNNGNSTPNYEVPNLNNSGSTEGK